MRHRLATSLLAILLPVLLATGARAEKEDAPAEGRRRAPHMNEGAARRLNEAVEQLNAGQPAEARAVLGQLNLERLGPYERSRVEQLFATIDLSEDHYSSARDHLAKALASGGLNEQESSAARFQIAQLYMAEELWREGIDALEEWFRTEAHPNSAAYYLLAVAHYQLEDFAAALGPAQKAIDLAEGKPQENWLQLLVALRMKREEYALTIPLLKQLIEIVPSKKSYWIQLSSASTALENYHAGALMLQLPYNGGLLTEDQEIRRLAQLLVHVRIPHRAARVLTRALETRQVNGDAKLYELLGQCWIAAHEYRKAIGPLRRAARQSDTGDLYVRLAEIHVTLEDWKEAARSLERAHQKGHLKAKGHAALLFGIALYNQRDLTGARRWFTRANDHRESRPQAKGWLRQIDLDLKTQSS